MSIHVGERIRETRKARGLSQDQLAELASLNHVTIAKYESGRVEPGARALSRIADALDVRVDELLGRIQEELVDSATIRPITVEAKIISAGIDKMPPKDRERALNMMKLMFSEFEDTFKKDEDDDT